MGAREREPAHGRCELPWQERTCDAKLSNGSGFSKPRHGAATPHPGFLHLKNYFTTGGACMTGSTRPLLLARPVAGGYVEFELQTTRAAGR